MSKFTIRDTGVFRTDELVILNEKGIAIVQSVADGNGLHDNQGVLEIIDYIAALEARLQEAEAIIKPFANDDFSRELSGNFEGDLSPVFQRVQAMLTLGDFRRARSFLNDK